MSLINSRTFKIQHIFFPAIDFARSYNAAALTNDPPGTLFPPLISPLEYEGIRCRSNPRTYIQANGRMGYERGRQEGRI